MAGELRGNNWRIFVKTPKDDLRTKCELCKESFEVGDRLLEIQGGNNWNYSLTVRFHIKCLKFMLI